MLRAVFPCCRFYRKDWLGQGFQETGASLGRRPYIGGWAGRALPVGYGGPARAGKLKLSGKGGRASPWKGRPAGCFLRNTSPEKGGRPGVYGGDDGLACRGGSLEESELKGAVGMKARLDPDINGPENLLAGL